MKKAREEYPRPQFVRPDWLNLNGEWEFELDQGCSGSDRRLFEAAHLADKINVPFCPESELSGVGHKDFIRGCWYRRDVDIPGKWLEGRLLLHFGAVDYESDIYVNGKKAAHHTGGYVSFTVDITGLAHAGANSISVAAYSDVRSDRQPTGKQSVRLNGFGCLYTRTTGIWQTVWLEPVAKRYMTDFRLTPDVDNGRLDISLNVPGNAEKLILRAKASYDGHEVGGTQVVCAGANVSAQLPLDEIWLWEPGAPRLYDLELSLEDADSTLDTVKSYFGMRSIRTRGNEVLLNGRPLYQRLVLDQGFNPAGIITAPSDAELKADIERSMALGFNGARMHQKIFEQRFMYWADHMGYLLWGEYPNWGLSVKNGMGMPGFVNEWLEEVKRDISSPSIIGWCPFNETETATDLELMRAVYRMTKAIDPARLCIDTSGWVHCDETDIFDYHDYTFNPEIFREHCRVYASAQAGKPFPVVPDMFPYMGRRAPEIIGHGQPIFVSEFGGIGWKMPSEAERAAAGRTIASNPSADAWGYGANPVTEDEFMARFSGQMDAVMQTPGICGFCYTQLTDVEQEINGLYTYDRVPKFDVETIRGIISRKAWNE